MSDLSSPVPPGNGAAGGPAAPQGPLVLNLQYTKDLSFEVPGAPEIFVTLREQPRIDIGLDVQARPLQQANVYEVSLQIRCDAKAGEQTAFIAELVYCGIFTITVEQNVLEPVLLVECPRLLFPFARAVVAPWCGAGARRGELQPSATAGGSGNTAQHGPLPRAGAALM